MAKSIKTNYIFQVISNVTGFLFPMITFPYVSRVLGAESLGELGFYGSIVGYVQLFSSLGIATYAMREVAKIRENTKELSNITTEILSLHIILSLIGYIAIIVLGFFLPQITDKTLFFISSLSIFFNAIGVSWFYNGVEEFKFITIRALIVRCLSLIALFVFVHDTNDLLIYAILNILATVGNNMFNFIRLWKYVELKSVVLHKLNLFRHIKPLLHVFMLTLSVNIYFNLDQTMLGFLSNTEAVGYYAACIRLNHMIMWTTLSVTAVLAPRLCNLVENNRDEFYRISKKGINAILFIALPVSSLVFILAKPIINLFCGDEYEPSICTLQILTPILIFGCVSNFLSNILYSMNKVNQTIIATTSGALMNMIFNFWLIPQYAQYGAAISSLIAELIVFSIMALFTIKVVCIPIFEKENYKIIVLTVILVIFACIGVNIIPDNNFISLILGAGFGIAAAILYAYISKLELLLDIIFYIKNKLVFK
ncbi:MAG: flippase [Bacteroidaceae bacterium]|nr:flippase [Bacteroidaceae bacterium]